MLLETAEIGEPVPGEDALDGDDDVLAVRRDRFEEGPRVRGHVAMKQGLSTLVQDADVHRSGVEIDAAVVSMLLVVEVHEASSLWVGVDDRQHTKWVCAGRGPQ